MNGEPPAAVAPAPQAVRHRQNHRAWVLSLIVLAAITALGLLTLFVLLRLLPSDVEIQIKRAGLTVTIVGGLGFFIVLFKVFFNSFTKLVGLFVTLMAVLIAVDVVGVGIEATPGDRLLTDSTAVQLPGSDIGESGQDAALEARRLEAVVSQQYASFNARIGELESRIDQLTRTTQEAAERTEDRYARMLRLQEAPAAVIAPRNDSVSQRLDRILEELIRLKAQVSRLEGAVDQLRRGAIRQ
ncbi:MAG TPA: hypothetical protein VF188_16990 [Longimicrobiales bacterium]